MDEKPKEEDLGHMNNDQGFKLHTIETQNQTDQFDTETPFNFGTSNQTATLPTFNEDQDQQ